MIMLIGVVMVVLLTFAYTGYNDTQIKKDNKFKELNAKQDEFRSIVEGEIMNSGGNVNIVQMPE